MKRLNDLMYDCFKKITIKIGPPSKRSPNSCNLRKILSDIAKKGKIQRNIVREYITHLVNLEAKVIASINARKVSERANSENDSLSHNSFWKLKDTKYENKVPSSKSKS